MKNQDETIQALNPSPITAQLDYLVGAVAGGAINPIEAVGALKLFAVAVDQAKKACTDAAMIELAKYGKEGFENDLMKAELRNTATRYDFKHIESWSKKKAELVEIETEAKIAHNMQLQMKQLVVDGEIIEPAISSGGGESVFIKLKKAK